LAVPFDYSKPVSRDVFELAIVKVPAKPNVPYKGVWILNQDFAPSTNFTSQTAWILQDFFGLAGWDFISYDMRGSGYSTPKLQCFPDNTTLAAFADGLRSNDNILGAFNGTFPPTRSNIKANINTVTSYLSKLGPGCNRFSGKYLP
jgi:pimeloyl-ACP methyl ester carboxylesterase